MTVGDYFKVSFKKPKIDETISMIVEKKNKLKSQLEFCYSRLESIEICNSNSKYSDALILSEYLAVDIVNLALIFTDKPIKTSPESSRELFHNFADEELKTLFSKLALSMDSNSESEEEKSEKIEIALAESIQRLENYIFKKHKTQFQNPVEDFKKKAIIQFIVSICIIVFSINAGIKKYNKVKAIENDIARIYYMNVKAPNPISSNLLVSDVKPSQEWSDVSFVLPNADEVSQIKVEPIHQIHARFQIREVKYLDANKNVIQSLTFKLNKAGMLDNTIKNEFCCMEDLKPSKLLPDSYVELESTNSKPSFYIKIEPIKDVKEIVFSFRYIKNSDKFLN